MDPPPGSTFRSVNKVAGEDLAESRVFSMGLACGWTCNGGLYQRRGRRRLMALIESDPQVLPSCGIYSHDLPRLQDVICSWFGPGAREVVAHLRERHLEDARSALAKIVGRDTKSLDEPEVMRGVIETVAENTSDGFIAPLFYLAIAGVPAAFAYKVINTLDSMIGYTNDRYFYFGWAAARLDDIANYLPARLTAALVAVAAFILRLDWRKSLRIVRRDARLQPSPNSGFPEAAYAGALRIRLGGLNFYEGRPSQKAYIGDPRRELTPDLYPEVRRLLYFTSALAVAVGIALSGTLRSLPWF